MNSFYRSKAISSINRIYWLDFGKVLAAFLVVFAHLYSENTLIQKYIYAFHLPFFFLISGVFHNDTGKIQWQKHAMRILFPAAIFLFIDAVVYIIHDALLAGGGWSGWAGQTVNYIKYFILSLIRGTGLGPAWFLLALFWCKILADLFLIIRQKWIACGIMIAGLLVPHLFSYRLPLFISQGFMATPFYLTGFYASRFLKSRNKSWKYLWLFLIGILLTGTLTFFNGKVSMNGFYFGSLHKGLNLFVFYLNGFIGSIMLMAFSLLPFPELKSIKLLATALITIVGVQNAFIRPSQWIFGFLNEPIPLSVIVAIFIMWLCYFTHLLIGPLYSPKK